MRSSKFYKEVKQNLEDFIDIRNKNDLKTTNDKSFVCGDRNK